LRNAEPSIRSHEVEENRKGAAAAFTRSTTTATRITLNLSHRREVRARQRTGRGDCDRHHGSGEVYTPEGIEPPYPTVVMAGGWCYVKELIQPEYAGFFVDAGMAALTFDNRNLGESEGEPRQHIDPWEQIYDIINAITYVSLRDDVDASRIGIWGISYAGGHVFPVAALDPRVKVILSVVPMLDGWYNSLRANSNVGMRELWDVIRKDRVERIRTGKHGTILHSAHPHEAPSTFPAPETWPIFKRFKKTVAPNHEHWTTIQSCEYVLMYDVTPYMKRIIPGHAHSSAAIPSSSMPPRDPILTPTSKSKNGMPASATKQPSPGSMRANSST
jgi:hypothetical protein